MYIYNCFHTFTKFHILQTQQNIQFQDSYIQIGNGIVCYTLIPATNYIHNQTGEFEFQLNSFPSGKWNC